MLGRLFGRKKEKPATRQADFPWSNLTEAGACNLAFGDLVNHATGFYFIEGRGPHAESTLAALGAIAGMAARVALFERIASGERSPEGLNTATLDDGRQFTFGDPLNLLLTQADPSIHSLGLWPVAAGATLQAGVAEHELPDLGEQFAIVTRRLGTPDEGWPDTPEGNRPAASTHDILARVWPIAKTILTQSYHDKPGPLGPAPLRLWPAITTIAVSPILGRTAAVLDPRIGLAIVMQSAIYASKLDPAALETGS
ncbi:hypothetical protein [Sphingomonas sp.]|uniref:hypothetical protein n=1 Tax=Sphingomonas sp. TaxID=28214 RepID=UPI001B0EA815|nr:hypothetical protein [Sphingomonas sp.]MBO9712827.1 hypothetical protein [Sphingomonas sp.]